MPIGVFGEHPESPSRLNTHIESRTAQAFEDPALPHSQHPTCLGGACETLATARGKTALRIIIRGFWPWSRDSCPRGPRGTKSQPSRLARARLESECAGSRKRRWQKRRTRQRDRAAITPAATEPVDLRLAELRQIVLSSQAQLRQGTRRSPPLLPADLSPALY
jgi:hypothetical protein